MSSPDAKRLKTDDDAAYELIYWPGIPGRGEFVRLLFEEAGVSYTDHAREDGDVSVALKYISAENIGDASNPPILAPPILKHGDLIINQLPNILLYLAPKLGLVPTEGDGLFHLNQIVLSLLDGFVNELHETHHPTATSLYYEDQKPEAKKRSKYFLAERIPKFLGYVQRLLDSKASGEGPWLYGGKLTYADLVLFQCLDGTQFAFPKSIKKQQDSGNYDGVFKLYEAVKELPNIGKYLASERRVAYADGIYRHYPELEED
ncbi:putative glutathione S-transferase family protein [Dactylonectria estremocensis]|uniref:Glutathione S-transferase family protein n=1 Tax=Dactylonectria estremocensis TaxID=1079267 RepID=A0A9P9ETV7_9HYPO|nr:putative glutathione S-transferase family protein [Dactylonectria estremocensis]